MVKVFIDPEWSRGRDGLLCVPRCSLPTLQESGRTKGTTATSQHMPTVKFGANPSKGDRMPDSVQETALTHLDHGWACVDKGEYDDAIAHYDEAIALDPAFAVAYALRGDAYKNKGEFDHAIVDFTKAIKLNPELVLAYNNRGHTYEMKGDKEQAIAEFRKALAIDPSQQQAIAALKRLGVKP